MGVASNSVRRTVEEMMQRSNLLAYLDFMISNEDVSLPKPDPEMYLLGMSRLGVTPEETLIVEDNENGVRAARASGAHVMVVEGPDDVTLDAIHHHIERARSADRVAA